MWFQQQLPIWMASAIAVLVAQPAWADVTTVTAVRLNPIDSGLEMILEIPTYGEQPQILPTSFGKTFVVNILNSQLRLSDGQGFRAENPTQGIAAITVTQQGVNSIRVTVTGTEVLPTVRVVENAKGLILSLTAPQATAEAPPTSAPSAPETPQAKPEEKKPSVTPADEPEATPEATTSEVEPEAATEEPAGEEEIEIVVTGKQEIEGYSVPNATTGTRTDTPLRDIPQSIQVVPRQVIEDQGATQLGDALRNISGVSLNSGSFTSFPDQFIIRGFQAASFNSSTYINGIRVRGRSFSDTANIEQVEVLKGPASVLFGQAEPGGIINTVTEQPLAEPFYAAEFNIGNYNFYRPTIDISGPLNADKTARYRLNVAYQNSGSFVDFLDLERFAIAPVFSLDLGENTTLTLEGEYLSNSTLDYDGLPAVGTVLSNPFGNVPKSRFLDDPDLRNQIYSDTAIGYRLQHKFSDNWSVRNAFRAELLDVNEDIVAPTLQLDNRSVRRTVDRGETNSDYYTLQTDFIGNLRTGSLNHQLLLGLDLFRGTTDLTRFSTSLPTIDLFNPVYERAPVQFTNRSFDYFEQQNIIGVYAQDLISFTDNLKLLLGGRFDWVDSSRDNRINDQEYEQQDTAFSPRVGIVYQPIEPVSLYASYSRSFLPTGLFTVNADGTPFEPTKGEQFEVGVKTEFLDGRLSTTLAAYEITKQNIVTTDPNNSAFSIQVGEQRSRGIELDVVGEILPGLNLIATYAYTDAEVTEDNSGNEGNQPNNVPRHSGSLWATYEIQSGDLQGLGFGAGVFITGDRQGDLANTFELPGFVRTDAAIFYRRDTWRLGLNFKNLFDEGYFEFARGRNNVFPGAPFTVLGTISIDF